MIRFISIFKSELKKRPLFLWDTGKRSMQIMLRLALRGIAVSGFVASVPRFISDMIIGLPVISLESLHDIDHPLIIVDDHLPETEISIISRYGDILKISDCLEYDPDLACSPVYIYGIGEKAWSYIKNSNVIAMASFPSEGCTKIIDGVLVIKLSDAPWIS